MNESESRAALQRLTGPLPATEVEALEAQHASVKPRLRELVRGLPARRRRRRLLRSVVAVSGIVAIAGGAIFALHLGRQDEAPFTTEVGSSKPIGGSGNGFVTGPTETTTLRTRGGALAFVGAGSRVEAITTVADQERLVLTRGSVFVRVPPLARGKSLSVKTPDALVTVHGTAFKVEVADSLPPIRTCVSVDEGVVSVERGDARVTLRRGERDGCGSAETAAINEQSASPFPPTTRSSLATVVAAPHAAAEGTSNSPSRAKTKARSAGRDDELADQNRLLAAGLRAEQAGRMAEAEQRLLLLIERYPDSPLRLEAERSLARIRRRSP